MLTSFVNVNGQESRKLNCAALEIVRKAVEKVMEERIKPQMNKSILVVDTPEKCEECKLCKNYKRVQHAWGNPDTYEVHCIGRGNTVMRETIKEYWPDWCPLLDFPEKMVEENRWFSEEYARGFNTCIDEILKGDETE